ncbi:C25 family cysteine peptidase [Flaviaesturariibacter amylovorans]|uniref:Gingipain domain-containing protein n=1 Tax=Flaviaesturariibacter amylovorans TaxID=1084520 RepID=A0ABP8GL64_9BACT
MKRILLALLVLAGFTAQAQQYNNEWIDHGKTYFKFKVGSNGLYRIPQATLAAAGLGSVPAPHFQLFRNGKEVPLFTSVANGVLGGSDYIEFWGEMNDGGPDNILYRDPAYQMNRRWSLQTDTATYFLTVNEGNNKRLETTANNVAGTSLTPEPYFIHKAGNYFKNQISAGYAVNVGDYMYSSAYDRAEGWSSSNIATNATLTTSLTGLFPYTGAAPTPQFRIAMAGTATNPRRYRVNLNGDSLMGGPINYFNEVTDSVAVPVTRFASGTASVAVTNVTTFGSDRMVVHQYELTYPRLFNFGNATSFDFTLPATAVGQYIQVSNFSAGSAAPVLLDLTNGLRLVANTATAGQYRFVLPPSATPRRLVMVRGETPATAQTVSTLTPRTFVNYNLAANQGNYLIVTNAALTQTVNGTNPVEAYRAYRSSTDGGSYTAKVYLIDELVDQFAFGIKMHPSSIVNFTRFARNRFGIDPRHLFIIGKGVNYVSARNGEAQPTMARLNLVPTFGNPASDNMLTAEPGTSNQRTPVGRLSVISGTEILTYLSKVKQYEAAQRLQSPLIADKAWMKNVVHLSGSTEPTLYAILAAYLGQYGRIISDTLYGAKVTTFLKNSANTVEQINSGELDRLFTEGISLITYFGHSASSHLEYNLNNPDQYNNPGKYPMFMALGCNVGNVYSGNSARLSALETLSEQFVMAPNRGSIGFIASSHFGITDYLHLLSARIYQHITYKSYGASIGEILMHSTEDVFAVNTQEDFYARATCEESNLNGDPAITLNPHAQPDYVIEDPLVRTSPSFVSVADNSFRLRAQVLNMGRAVSDSIVVEVKREFPGGNSLVIYRDTLRGIRFRDSISIDVPIEPLRDKGLNRITVTVDADGAVDELFENNNSITKDIFIYEDEARPVYPYNFSIVNRQNVKFVVSTANPFASTRTYRMELDTTAMFNSPLKVSNDLNAPGGIVEFNPSVNFRDNTVYYWRVAEVVTSGVPNWAEASFLYRAGTDTGYNQSHYFQHQGTRFSRMRLDSASRRYQFNPVQHELYIRNGVFGTGYATGQAGDLVINVNGVNYIRNACNYSMVFNVFDKTTFRPWVNGSGQYGSAVCTNTLRRFNYEFLNDTAGRRKAVAFLDQIPDGNFVVLRSIMRGEDHLNQYVSHWINDANLYGTNHTFYNVLKQAGFTLIDSVTRPRAFAFVFQKNRPSFTPAQGMSVGKFDVMTMTVMAPATDSTGTMTSPRFGPAAAWKELNWGGTSLEAPSQDTVSLNLIGIKTDGSVDTLLRNISRTQTSVDIRNVPAATYPYLQLHMTVTDTSSFTPYQLDHWRLYYTPKAEGAVAPNLLFQMKDTFDVGEPLDFKLAFKNVSDVAFDSLKVKVVITDRNNVTRVLPLGRFKPLPAGDTLHVRFPVDTRLIGANSMYVDVNPDNDQPELYHFNNFIYKNFFVRGDTLNPLLDVTFDNRHILNGDIVAAKPGIEIRLKDEAKYRLLDDTSLVTVQVRDPQLNVRSYAFNSDTLRFEPATSAGNEAKVRFNPHFTEDGEYELIVSGRDKSGNGAGRIEYRVAFQVINKATISNIFNYPNPFTTSTAFVFTITGAEVPQNLRIQILTVTGKIVREITKAELGPLNIGRNITEYKWDGTDQYGQQLGNGVYLYRIITNHNGKSMEKFNLSTNSIDADTKDKTDRFFKGGYGKMYLMR